MALRKPGQNTTQGATQGAPIEDANTTSSAPQDTNLPATQDQGPVSVPQSVDFHNGDGEVLIGFEALGGGGNFHYVKMDGTDFVIGGFEGDDLREKELQYIVSQARIYFYNRDTQHEIPFSPQVRKSPPGYSLRAEVTFYDWVEGSEEPHEFRLTLPNNSVYRFKEYYEGLSKKGLRINQSITKSKIIRKKNDAQQIFSECQFEYVGPAETE